ncbi:UV DNA damage repair endonuclease UvsE [Lacticigenium naphthae]|uniref:UV DNA damage repair endonuclease UvsE n=1 Tax=Lacticigenium naphthae TaxID=515351 RepID=UPI000416C915|nr:UV DNA damage repair endonuclease UvsE [Lacticigenium naphthae]
MSIGYACLTVGIPNTDLKSVTKKNATEERLKEVIQHNLNALENMIDYNSKQNIRLYRISSDLIPFGSSPVNTLNWGEIYGEDFRRIGKKIKNNDLRVSFHPGQYTVLNSPHSDVVERAIEDLRYHNKIMECMEIDFTHKIVVHIGGVYGNKEEAIKRFIQTFRKLDQPIKNRLIIENDDRLYTVEDVLGIAEACSIPVVFDNLHHTANHQGDPKTEAYWIKEVNNTWREMDGKQKVHYSQQASSKRIGAHTKTIYIGPFLDFYRTLPDTSIDIMLEVKDKNISTIKINNALSIDKNIARLEKEWARYKYAVLEKSPENYQAIRQLLKNKNEYPVIQFYQLIEEAMDTITFEGNAVNAAQHVWGYLNDGAIESEKRAFERNLTKYRNNEGKLRTVKNQLLKLAEKQAKDYLIQSLYFY